MMDPTEKSDETWPGIEANTPSDVPTSELADARKSTVRSEKPNVQLAEKYLAEGVFSGKALRIFEEATAARPDRPDLQNALSISYLVQAVTETIHKMVGEGIEPESTGEQRERMEGLLGQFPRSADLAKCLGDARLLDGDWEGACHAFRLARSNGYRDDQAIVNSGRVILRSPDCPSGPCTYFGDVSLALGQFPMVVEFFTEALHRSKGNREATLALLDQIRERVLTRLVHLPDRQSLLAEVVCTCVELDLIDRALDALREVDLSKFGRPDLVKRIARHLIDNEDYRQAFDYLSRIPFDRDTKNLVNEITIKLEQRGEVDTAVYLLQYINEHDLVVQEARRIADDRLESAATRELAELCMRSNRFDAALSHYLHLIRHNVDDVSEFADEIEKAAMHVTKPNVEDLICLGEFFHNRHDLRRAESVLNRALEFDPESRAARVLLRQIYDDFLETEPNLGRVRLLSGDLHLADHNFEEAIAEYKMCLESPGYEMEARRRLAGAFVQAGEPKLAIAQFQDLALRTSDLDVLYTLHEDLMNANMCEEALEAASMIFEFDNRYRDVEERITQLQRAVRQQDADQQLRDPKMTELIGDQAAGRYRYIEQIGSGGMGIVHKVYDAKSQCTVAMKILRESLTGSSKAIDRFFREARIAATLSHPNIVDIYDYNITTIHGKSYISMEFVDGPSLRDIIEERFTASGELTSEFVAEILYYASQICDALETTHLKGIIHRDIKPDNIMITSGQIVKITDFGIVHVEEATFTPTGALIGTPRYMSPEQIRGSRVDCRSDIYAVGIIIYESLIGTPPFISGDIAYQHVNVPPTPPREINPFIPEPVEAVILRCLEKDPNQRYQRAKDVKQAVDEVLQKLYPQITSRLYKGKPVSSTVESPSITQ